MTGPSSPVVVRSCARMTRIEEVNDACETLAIYSVLIPMLIRENVPLAPLTTLGVGGPGTLSSPKLTTEAEVLEAVDFARSRDLPLFVLGGGSNLVVADAGFAGLVVKIASTQAFRISLRRRRGLHRGRRLRLGRICRANRRSQLRGAGMSQRNSGYGRRNAGAERRRLRAGCFRDNHRSAGARSASLRDRNAVERRVRIRLSLQHLQHDRARTLHRPASCRSRCDRTAAPNLRYADLEKYFAERSDEPTLKEVRDAVREIRHRKAMLIVSGEDDAHSAGSFFKNPVVPQSFEELAAGSRRKY